MLQYRDGTPINVGDVVYWASSLKYDPQVRRGTIKKIVEKETKGWPYKKGSYVSIMPDEPFAMSYAGNPMHIPIYNVKGLMKHSHCNNCSNVKTEKLPESKW